MSINYFYGKTNGLNADIERHRLEKMKLEEKINSLESKDEISKMDQRRLNTYRNFLCQLNSILLINLVEIKDKRLDILKRIK